MADVRIKFIAETQNFSSEIDKANTSLKQFGMEGATLSHALKSKNLDAVAAVMARNRNATLASGDALKAFKNETNDLGKVFKAVAKDSEGWRGSSISENGSTGPLGKLTSGDALNRLKEMADVTQNMTKAVKEYYANIPTDDRSTDPFSSDKFITDVQAKGDAISLFGTELEAVSKKMSMISSEGQRLVLSGGDPQEVKKLSEEYHRLSTEHDRLSQSANGTSTRIKNLVKNFVSAQLVVYAIRKTFQLVTQGFKESSLAAAEAEQVTQKFITVFEGFSKASE
ncbi:MAG: hypothetical protein EOM62_21385, partial [Bacteroidia bacterium]|nr:hypothetical protein [Bacteroidia bacterium]